MATLENHSSYTASIKHRDDLHRECPFTSVAQAKQYAIELGKHNYTSCQCRRRNPKHHSMRQPPGTIPGRRQP